MSGTNAKQKYPCSLSTLYKSMKLIAIILLLNIFAAYICSAQQGDITAIDKAINDNNIPQAEALLNQSISKYRKAGLEDTLVNYIFYIGKTERKKSNADNAVKKVQEFVRTIEKNTNKRIHPQAGIS